MSRFSSCLGTLDMPLFFSYHIKRKKVRLRLNLVLRTLDSFKKKRKEKHSFVLFIDE